MRHWQPPGETSRVCARHVLVLAPHYDDEVLGCGGLLAELAESGADIHIVFLSDSSGGVEGVDNPTAYGARRREESERAGRVLGVRRTEHLGLRDGQLAYHRDDLRRAIEERLRGTNFDLLLLPSPLEISSDHQAAFAALHDVLTTCRVESGEDSWAEGLTVLLYEINHPLHPNILVDVSAQSSTLEAAMSCYVTQQGLHDYAKVGLSLRRYRTLTLAPEVALAEGYRKLDAFEFTTSSLADLVRFLGGVAESSEVRAGPRISVIVRTKDRPEQLPQALASLAASTYRRVELVVVNDGGVTPALPNPFPFPTVSVELPENRGRAAAAQAGVDAASGDYISFLDDDDLFAPEHLETLATTVAKSASSVVYTDAALAIYRSDDGEGWHSEERVLQYSRDFDPELLLFDNYIPFITLLIEKKWFAEIGPFDTSFAFFEDWDYLIRLSSRVRFQHVPRVTCEYRHFMGSHAHALGGDAAERGNFLEVKARVLAKHHDRVTDDKLAYAVHKLRAEAVRSKDELSHVRGLLEQLRRDHRMLEADFHRLKLARRNDDKPSGLG